jgi:hypothetical protein
MRRLSQEQEPSVIVPASGANFDALLDAKEANAQAKQAQAQAQALLPAQIGAAGEAGNCARFRGEKRSRKLRPIPHGFRYTG